MLGSGTRIDPALAAILRLRVGEVCLRFQHLRFGFVALGRVLHFRERKLCLGLMQLRNSQAKLGLSLIALGGGITRIDNHQQIALFHALVITHVQRRDIPRRFRGNRHHIAVGKGVVSCLFVTG